VLSVIVVLQGGGWSAAAAPACYGPFLAAAGPAAAIGCVVVDEGDGPEYYQRFADVLTGVAPCRPEPLLVPVGAGFDPARLDGFDALFVCGGLTPAYGTALGPVAGAIRDWLSAGRPYAGFSAGSALAAAAAVVGGYRVRGRVVCPPDAGEDLQEVSVVDGLGLVPFAVDVHAAQWGTLGRLCAAVAEGLVPAGVAVDEDTALVVEGDAITVVGAGAAHVVTAALPGTRVRSVPAGHTLTLD
jgi:cyanophycinase